MNPATRRPSIWGQPRVLAAGLVASVATLAAGLVGTWYAVQAIPPAVPNPTEVYESFGDAMVAFFRLMVGGAASLVAAAVAGWAVGRRAGSRPW